MPNIFVVLMGIGTVFVGLICIIFLSMLTSKVCNMLTKKSDTAAPTAPVTPAPAATTTAIPNRQAMIAAIAVAIAEDLGTDPSGIRILSVKKA